jgi:hypothetical protein
MNDCLRAASTLDIDFRSWPEADWERCEVVTRRLRGSHARAARLGHPALA